MKKKLPFLILSLVLLSSLIVGAWGCKSTTQTATVTQTATATLTTTTSQTTTTTETATSKYGGVLVNMSSSTPSGNIGWLPTQRGTRYWSPAYETLIDAHLDGNFEGRLAESWKLADDLSSITLNLRQGVKFHDGSPFNAEACKWNLELSMAKPVCSNWESVEIVDDYTVKINFSEYHQDTLSNLGDIYGMMMSKQAFDTEGQAYLEQHPVGTGPFIFDNYATGVSTEWTRNNDYWMKDEQGNQLPYLDGLKTVYISDKMTQLAAMESGDVMMMEGGGGITYVNLDDAGFNVFPSPLTNTFSIIPDSKNADSPWADPKVREAVSYCLDREAIAQIAELKFGQPAYQLSNPKNLSYNPNIAPIPYDLNKANQLMAESSHPDGFDTNIYTLVFTGKDTMVAIQSSLAEIGINAEINLLSFGEGSELQASGWHNGCYCSPNSNLLNFNFAMGLQNAWGKNAVTDIASMDIPAEFQTLINQALSGETEDRAKSRAAAKLLQDNFLVIPVYYANSMWALSPIIQDLDCTEFQNSMYRTIWKAWLSK